MEGKSSEWRPGPTVCRCCLSEGCYKDISTEYFWMGKREVYAEMLSETLSLSIAYSTSTGPNSNSRLICEQCISRLRDASEFKRQVADCEKTFMQHLDPSSSKSRELDTIGDVKVEVVKHEKDDVSEDDFDDRPDFLDVDSDDDLDNQPLTKLATKTPKKELDILDLLDNSQITVKRKSNLKTKEPPKKVAKKKESKPASSKASPAKPEKKKETKYPSASAAKRNAEVILKHATVYPFRLPENCMVCVFCCEGFDNCALFRAHMEDEHQTVPIKMAFTHCSEGFIKADCSDIRCRICSEQADSLEDIAVHLRKVHNKQIQLTEPFGIQPFKPDKLTCVICTAKSFSLRQLSRHTQTHFLRYTCESCGKSYATNTALQVHIKYTHVIKKEQHCCRKCRMFFDSLNERRNHVLENKKCWPYLCHLCGERYISWKVKQAHMKDAHGKEDGPYSCPECGKIFADKKSCNEHFKITHTDDNYVCSYCGLKFTSKHYYEEHKVGHTTEKPYSCSVCYKSFARKKNLTQHLWIHSEYKRFECKLCNKKFNQKVCLRSHNKTNHPELTDFEDQNSGVKYLLSVLKK